jgi:hypothetical protein
MHYKKYYELTVPIEVVTDVLTPLTICPDHATAPFNIIDARTIHERE